MNLIVKSFFLLFLLFKLSFSNSTNRHLDKNHINRRLTKINITFNRINVLIKEYQLNYEHYVRCEINFENFDRDANKSIETIQYQYVNKLRKYFIDYLK